MACQFNSSAAGLVCSRHDDFSARTCSVAEHFFWQDVGATALKSGVGIAKTSIKNCAIANAKLILDTHSAQMQNCNITGSTVQIASQVKSVEMKDCSVTRSTIQILEQVDKAEVVANVFEDVNITVDNNVTVVRNNGPVYSVGQTKGKLRGCDPTGGTGVGTHSP